MSFLPTVNNMQQVEDLMKSWPFQHVIPYNLWFRTPLLEIKGVTTKEFCYRTRTFCKLLLNPYLSLYDRKYDASLNRLIRAGVNVNDMSLIQPFYPETFFSVYELLHHYRWNGTNFLSIVNENKSGSVEAFSYYGDKFAPQKINNDVLLSSQFHYGNRTIKPLPDRMQYIPQFYDVRYVPDLQALIQYDIIFIDTAPFMSGINQFVNDRLHLWTTMYFINQCKSKLNESGKMIITLNMLSNTEWHFMFNACERIFKHVEFYRSTYAHACHGELYLIATGPTHVNFNLHQMGYYPHIKPFHVPAKLNAITNTYIQHVQQWQKQMQASTQVNVQAWYEKCHILPMSHIQTVIPVNIYQSLIQTLTPSVENDVVNLHHDESYAALLKSAQSLALYKRVINTNPNCKTKCNMNLDRMFFVIWNNFDYTLINNYHLRKSLIQKYKCQVMSNAWLKMYEIISTFPQLLGENEIVHTFHICESPGAFISALHHFVSNQSRQLEWYAQTLDTRIEGAVDDTYGLIEHYKNRWLIGPYAGDITNVKTIQYYAKHKLLKHLDFITADGGIPLGSHEYNAQESKTAQVNLGQVTCILACLAVGKSAMFKTFLPLIEPLNISLIALCQTLFDSVTFHKPPSSCKKNSEIYVILQGYRGIATETLQRLYDVMNIKPFDTQIQIMPLTESQIAACVQAIIPFMNSQIETLQYYHHCYHYDARKTQFMEYEVTKWSAQFSITPLQQFLF